MRKDALRSLILWPAIASATISGVWWLSAVNSPVWQAAVTKAKVAWHQTRPEWIEPYLLDQFAWDRPIESSITNPLQDRFEIAKPIEVPAGVQMKVAAQKIAVEQIDVFTQVKLVPQLDIEAPLNVDALSSVDAQTNGVTQLDIDAPSNVEAQSNVGAPSNVEAQSNVNAQSNVVARASRALHEQPLTPIVEIAAAEVQERIDQGAAAMKLPARLDPTPSEHAQTLFAPRIDEAFEVAGLQLPTYPDVEDTAFPVGGDDYDINALAYERIAIQVNDPADTHVQDQTTPANFANRPSISRMTSDSPVIVLLEVIDADDFANSNNVFPAVAWPQPPVFSTETARQNIASAADRVVSLAKSIRAKVHALQDLARTISAIPLPQQSVARAIAPPVKSTRPSIMPKSIAHLANLAARPADDEVPEPSGATIDVAKTAKVAKRSIENNPATWPLTTRLNEQLDTLAALTLNHSQGTTNQLVSTASTATLATRWIDEVADRLAQLRSLDRLGNDRAGILIDQLDALAQEGAEHAEQTLDRQQQIEWLRTSYAVARRVALWKPVFRIATADSLRGNRQYPTSSSDTIVQIVQQVRTELPVTGDFAGWQRFLMLDEIAEAAEFGDVDDRNTVAKRFLSRLQWHGLDPRHSDWLDRDSIQQLGQAVRPWTSEAIDYAALLNQVERREADATALAESTICDAFQTLRFADNADTVAVADALNTHYRNANVRVALTESMLTRMLPGIEQTTLPVRTQILGSKVRGVSRISSDLKVDLVPANDRWSLKIRTLGKVNTQSVGRNGPAVFNTRRDSLFAADTPLAITGRDIQIGGSNINVQGATRLKNIRTNYDGWPLFGSLVRSVAESKYYESSGTSNRIADRKIRTELASEIQDRLNERVQTRSGQLEQVLLGPLGRLQLDPMVVDLKTTEDRLSARYRLAGDWQLGAFTPRPRAPRSSLMSLQVHESAINNTLERMVPRDHSKAIEQMILDGFDLFGQAEPEIPSDLPEDVHVQFAKRSPIALEIVDGSAWITLRIVRLTRGDRMKLSHFIVRAEYRPEIDGLHAYLVREGHLRISGPGMSMRERFPVRAIFNKVLSPSRKFALTVPALVNHPKMQDLAVSQLELRDGWIGLAISEQTAPRVAIRPRSK